ncbi:MULTISPECIES: hypothetical protein [unclassified Sporosarcina]|nr:MULTISPECIES: hypothetical protein [unclassified Sporosarcina]
MRLTGALPVWLIAEAIRKRRSEFKDAPLSHHNAVTPCKPVMM